MALATILSLAAAPTARASVPPGEAPQADLPAAPDAATEPVSDDRGTRLRDDRHAAPDDAATPNSDDRDFQLRRDLDSQARSVRLRSLEAPRPKPPLSPVRIGGEVLAYGAIGLFGGLGAAGIGTKVSGRPLGEFGNAGTFAGGFLGVALTGPFGVYAVGNLGDETGSLGWTYLGALAGLGVAAAGGSLLFLGSSATGDAGAVPGAILLVGAPIAGPIIGFNYSREYTHLPGTRSAQEGLSLDNAPRTKPGFSIVPSVTVTPALSAVGAAGRF